MQTRGVSTCMCLLSCPPPIRYGEVPPQHGRDRSAAGAGPPGQHPRRQEVRRTPPWSPLQMSAGPLIPRLATSTACGVSGQFPIQVEHWSYMQLVWIKLVGQSRPNISHHFKNSARFFPLFTCRRPTVRLIHLLKRHPKWVFGFWLSFFLGGTQSD